MRFICAAVLCHLSICARVPFAAEAVSTGSAAAVHLNTVGYLPKSPKLATVAVRGEEFVVRHAETGAEAFRGKLLPIGPKAGNEEPLLVADFSALNREGVYHIEIHDEGASCKFRIANDLYNWPFYCAIRAMYLWRCGTAVSAEFAGRHFGHAACHLDDADLKYVGQGADKRRDATGGWHDAGDYNKYSVNAAFTLGTMFRAWDDFRDRLAPLKLDIPESGNQVPDFLDEARWELEWLLKMQAADGRVYHKISTLKFGGFIFPEHEKERRYFSPWSSAATADFAAIMAQAARVFRTYDDQFAGRCLAAAKKSYEFLRANPADHQPDLSAFSTGGYHAPDTDDRLWAAAELWETTGDAACLHDLEKRLGVNDSERGKKRSTIDSNWDWGHLRNLAVFTYVLSARPGRDPALVARVRQDVLQVADGMVEAASRHPYGRPLDNKYYWGCNGTVARQTMNLNVAHKISGDKRYRDTTLDAINHLFGRNPFGRSYVTGLGYKPPMFPHDRRSGGEKGARPWPGHLIGGPWPGPTDWFDVQDDYRTNEIAINWNGALIYALAAFVEPQTFDASIKAFRNTASANSATGQ